jgi:hypothetical protein
MGLEPLARLILTYVITRLIRIRQFGAHWVCLTRLAYASE